jgi:leader peptidase (prepilin peptidase)/N-methyltransferase
VTELAEILAEYPALFVGSVFVLSLLVGSFLNVVIYRLPIMLDREWRQHAHEMLHEERPEPEAPDAEGPGPGDAASTGEAAPAAVADPPPETFNLVVPRSRCPHCRAEIKAHQNVPVVSYLLLGGKCDV